MAKKTEPTSAGGKRGYGSPAPEPAAGGLLDRLLRLLRIRR